MPILQECLLTMRATNQVKTPTEPEEYNKASFTSILLFLRQNHLESRRRWNNKSITVWI
jgi:hypothetical protein